MSGKQRKPRRKITCAEDVLGNAFDKPRPIKVGLFLKLLKNRNKYKLQERELLIDDAAILVLVSKLIVDGESSQSDIIWLKNMLEGYGLLNARRLEEALKYVKLKQNKDLIQEGIVDILMQYSTYKSQ